MAGCETESLGRTLSALRDTTGSSKDAYTDYIVGKRVNGLSEENTCKGNCATFVASSKLTRVDAHYTLQFCA